MVWSGTVVVFTVTENLFKLTGFKVFLNGMTVPIAEDAWGYEDGDIVIYSSPSTVYSLLM